jgi:AraC-like DNA-binding protein
MSNRSLTQALGHRFGLINPPVLQSGHIARPDVVFARLAAENAFSRPSRDVPREDSYTFQVALKPVHSAEFWSRSRHVRPRNIRTGETFLFYLADNPRVMMHDSFDFVRFNISKRSLDELAYRNELCTPEGLLQSDFGAVDPVMLGLATALQGAFLLPQEVNALFLDHLAHAFHIHVVTVYGRLIDPSGRTAGGLSRRQLRECCEIMLESSDKNTTIDALARICNMSPRHLARAFQHSTGHPPHQWLIRARVKRAAHMLADSHAPIADIAIACGFTDQSHLTRTFSRVNGQTPAEWRRRLR